MTKPLDADEEALAALLARAGLTAPASRALAALLRGGAWSAQEVAAATGLARQDVSRVARELDAAGAVRVEKAASDGGRPALRYHAARAGVAAVVARRRRQLEEERAALDALEARL